MDSHSLPRSSIETRAFNEKQKARNLINEVKCLHDVDGRLDMLEITMLQFINDTSNEIIKNVSIGFQFGPDVHLASDYLHGMMAQAQFLHAHYLMYWSQELNRQFRKTSKFSRLSTTISLD